MTPFYNLQAVLSAVPGQIDALVTTLFPAARKQAGCYRLGSLQGDKGGSLSISTHHHNAGCYIDHADPNGAKGNAVGLVAEARHLAYADAIKWLAEFLGVRPEEQFVRPKPRPKPVIDKDSVRGLDAKSQGFAATRGIRPETLRAGRCASTGTHIAFPHFDDAGDVVMLKYWSCDGRKNIYTTEGGIPTLYGKHMVDPLRSGGAVIITEGHWDALTWQQLGYPAVSIPNGVSNLDWVAEDWVWLNQFSEIYLDFDDDEPGREGEAKAKSRLGYERCKSIKYRFKDANDALKAGEEEVLRAAFKEAQEAPVERIVRASDLRDQVKQFLLKTNQLKGVPFFMPKLQLEFRPHEMTLWFGLSSHGKSSLLSDQIAFQAGIGIRSFVASFEQNNKMTIGGMLRQFTADPDIGCSEDFEAAYDALTDCVYFYDSMQRVKPDELLATMTMAHRQLGICSFVIDNVMTLDVDRQDNTAQAATADKFRAFVAQYPVHLHIVAHPRKPGDQAGAKPPGTSDIRGAAEWGDMPQNVIVVWRDMAKAERISQMIDEGMDWEAIEAFRLSCPDGKVIVRKQRDSGHLPLASYAYDSATKRAFDRRHPEDKPLPYWAEAQARLAGMTDDAVEIEAELAPEPF